MASGDIVQVLYPRDFTPENGIPQDYSKYTQVGGVVGLPLKKLDNDGYQTIIRIPTNGTPVPTGVTFDILTVDDPNNPDVGKVFRLGVTMKVLASGTDNLTLTGAGTEQTVDVTCNATSGVVVTGTVAVTKALGDNFAASSLCLVRIRRIGSNAADTHQGVPLIVGVVVRDT